MPSSRLPLAGALLLLLLGGPAAAGQNAPDRRPPPTRDFSAEDRWRESWITARGARLQTAPSGDPAHGAALAVPIRFPDATEAWLNRPITLVALNRGEGEPGLVYHRLAYSVHVPAEMEGRIQGALLLKDKDGLFYTADTERPLVPGRWNRIVVDLGAESLDVQPRGHSGRWNLHSLATIQHLGFAFWGDTPPPDSAPEPTLLLDDITTWPLRTAPYREDGPLRVEGLEVLSPPRPTRYARFEIAFGLNRPVVNPFDQEHVRIDALVTPPGATEPIRVPAFYYQDFQRLQDEPRDRYRPSGAGRFRVRFTPRRAGEYRYTLEAVYTSVDEVPAVTETTRTAERSFRVRDADHPGFVRVSRRDARFFEFEDGGFFFPIGHNFRSPYDLRDWKTVHRKQDPDAPRPRDRGLDIYEEYLPRMAAAGENLLEVWMSSWWLALEWTPQWKGYHGLGRYNLENAWKLDRLLELCRRHGLRVQLVIDNHGKAAEKPQADHEWELSPYNRAAAPEGFLTHPEELFDLEGNPEVRRHYRNKLRYIAARWGYSPTIFAFEMWSELDLTGRIHGRHLERVYGHPNVRAWHVEMIDYLKQLDHGRHPVTTHYSGDYTVIDPAMVALPQIDYIVCDAYHAPKQPLINMLLRTDRFARRYNKPYMITEFGGNWNAASWAELHADLHAGLWTSWMTGAAGTALFWWFEHIDRADLYPHFAALARYTAGEDKRRRPGAPPLQQHPVQLAHAGETPPALGSLALGNGRRTYAWIYDTASMLAMPPPEERPHHVEITVVVPELAPGRYDVEAWDTWLGEILERETVTVAGSALSYRLPDFRTDIALKIKARDVLQAPQRQAGGAPPPPPASRSGR